MKLLILTSRVPWPLDKGDKLRIYHQIRYLSLNFDIELIALSENKDDSLAVQELGKYCQKINIIKLKKHKIAFGILQAFFQNKPMQIGYFYNKGIQNRIDDIIKNFEPDFVYGQLVRVSEYIKDENINKVLDLQDALSAGLLRRKEKSKGIFKFILAMEHKRMLRYEQEELKNFNALSIITQTDKDLLSENIRDKVTIVPNGVDFDFFTPQQSSKSFDLVFTGNMNYPPNILAAKFLVNNIMPIVWKKIPEVKIQLAGASPHPSVQNLASDKVDVSGWLDDIRNAYANAKIFIAPMQIGTGLQNKLLEAMAMKLPCITSELANSALKALNNEQILIAKTNDAEQYAENIIKLITDKQFLEKIANKGHEFVIKNYDWKSAVDKLTALFKDV